MMNAKCLRALAALLLLPLGACDSGDPAVDSGVSGDAPPPVFADAGTRDTAPIDAPGTDTGEDAAAPDGNPVLPPGDAGAAICEKLIADFAFALDVLKECTPGCACCTQEVIGIIYPGCPCPTYVNPAHAGMLSKLDSLRAEFSAYGCSGPTCKCKQPTRGECLQPPGASAGHCADQFD